MNQSHIRNFSIIAHIDHGKTTLSDRILEMTGAISAREVADLVLDSMDLEREKGITIKARAVRMQYRADDGQDYELHLIDTPGHVDFSYEVSRSLQACEGALLVIDAAQGIEAQTLANTYLAIEHNLEIIPVINKIDLPSASPDVVAHEIEKVIGIGREDMILASGKEGRGVHEILEAVIKRIPPPRGDAEAPLRALVFDSHYDSYRGVIAYIRVVDGEVRTGDRILVMSTEKAADLIEVGVFTPANRAVAILSAGEVGYIATGLKNVSDCQVGDTITLVNRPAAASLPGYRPAKPMVFAGLYPVESSDYGLLRDALERLKMNDAALSYAPESSVALGFGFRCGFLGLLHMEIVQERLEREFDVNLLTTSPSVEYIVRSRTGTELVVDNPANLPPIGSIDVILEPWMKISVVSPTRYIGAIMELVTTRRGTFEKMDYLDEQRVLLQYRVPLSEILVEFYDQMKSRSQGYASLDYSFDRYEKADLVKLDLMVNGQPVDALSLITHRDNSYIRGRDLAEKLRKLIPRQMFEVPIQAAIGSKVIARETIPAMRKNVLAKCYGGDISRKRKLLEKQSEGKKRMKRVGNVEIPQEAFMAVLKLGS
ncbi:MAG: elongation factor 4 [Chloroflexota bacterium]|nr:MAG: elongation factor 4 [Chloroflexota bacterium]